MKLATPATAFLLVRPVTVPVPPVCESVTLPVKPVTVLPLMSWTVAVAVQVAPDKIAEEQPVKTICVAVPGVNVTAAVWVIVIESVVSWAV